MPCRCRHAITFDFFFFAVTLLLALPFSLLRHAAMLPLSSSLRCYDTIDTIRCQAAALLFLSCQIRADDVYALLPLLMPALSRHITP